MFFMSPLRRNKNKTEEVEVVEILEPEYITRQDLEDYFNSLEEEQEELDTKVEDNKIFIWGITAAILISLILSIWALALALSMKGNKEVVFYKLDPISYYHGYPGADPAYPPYREGFDFDSERESFKIAPGYNEDYHFKQSEPKGN